jgi:hypothetical protein
MADFDGGNHQRLVVNAPAFAARFPTHIGFVHLDVPIRLAADPILVGSHHARAELVQDAESRLERVKPSCRWNCTADMPGVWLATR